MSGAKFCKDCKWSERTGLLRKVKTYARCLRPEASNTPPPHVVTGEAPPIEQYSRNYMRLSGEPCGPAGGLFEPRR